jgi:hypothetical protein
VCVQAVRFFVEGEWITVVVDDRVPCDANGSPIFGRCKDPHHVWVQVFNTSSIGELLPWIRIEVLPFKS